jgi:hypothetical protein
VRKDTATIVVSRKVVRAVIAKFLWGRIQHDVEGGLIFIKRLQGVQSCPLWVKSRHSRVFG